MITHVQLCIVLIEGNIYMRQWTLADDALVSELQSLCHWNVLETWQTDSFLLESLEVVINLQFPRAQSVMRSPNWYILGPRLPCPLESDAVVSSHLAPLHEASMLCRGRRSPSLATP
jgi:hypothetical protein